MLDQPTPQVLPDNRVTFSIHAPIASEVLLDGDWIHQRRGIQHTFKETTGAHTWIDWRQYLYEFVQMLFRD